MKSYIYLIVCFLCSINLNAQELDARATIKTNGLTVEAYVKSDTEIDFPLTSNVLVFNFAVSLPAFGSTDPAEAPDPGIPTSPLPGIGISETPVEIWNDRFVYTFVCNSGIIPSQTWIAEEERLLLSITFPASTTGQIPRLENLLNEGIGGGNSGQAYWYLLVNSDQRSDTEGLPFYGPGVSNYNSGDFYVESLTQLPVTLGDFVALKEGERSSKLNWYSVNESNSSEFLIERSTDKINWQRIGNVAAAGNSTTVNHYTYTDINVYNGRDTKLTVYYRLKMVDRDESFGLSKIQSVNFANSSFASLSYIMYPNPATEGVYIEWDQSTTGQPTLIEMFDASGKVVSSQKVAENSNKEYINFADNGVTSGMYSVRLLQNDTVLDVRQIIVGTN